MDDETKAQLLRKLEEVPCRHPALALAIAEYMVGPVAVEFHRLRREWQRDCATESNPDRIATHPAYCAIVAMGDSAVPLILAELESRPHQWFHALAQITGEDPVPADHAGRVALMAQDWIAWGQKKIAEVSSGSPGAEVPLAAAGSEQRPGSR